MSINGQFDAVTQPIRFDSTVLRLAEMNPASPQESGSVAPTNMSIAEALFRGPERWGWEHVEPAPVSRYPDIDQYPQWQEPDFTELQAKHDRARDRRPKLLRWAVGPTLLGFAIIGLGGSGTFTALGVILLLSGLSLGGGAQYLVHAPLSRINTGRFTRWQAFLMDQATFDAAITQHDAAEQWRVRTTPLLFPVRPAGHPSRVDVFGGSPVGWASLLATMGSSVLAGDSSLLVLDLSGQNVAGPLADYTEQAGLQVSSASAPLDFERTGLLGDVAPEDLAEILAAAMASKRDKADRADLQAIDVKLIRTVAQHLEQPRTFDRLAAGIEVLQSIYDDPDADGPLSSAEVVALTHQAHRIDKSERVRDELTFVGNQLELLTTQVLDLEDAGPDRSVQLWPEWGLSVIRTTGENSRRKEYADQVLFQAVAHHIANSATGAQDPVLVVVGADELGRSGLEAMIRSARRAGVRLVYIFEHLRENSAEILGAGDGVAVMMRLGNGVEAETAANYIGKRFTFQLSQLTRQLGRTVTVGKNIAAIRQDGGSHADTKGHNDGRTWSKSENQNFGRGLLFPRRGGRSEGASLSRSLSDTWSRSLTTTWSNSTTEGHNKAEAEAVNDGRTYQRAYEFTIEPTQIQDLEPTVFMLVHSGLEGRKVTMGDCFPGIAVLDRVGPERR